MNTSKTISTAFAIALLGITSSANSAEVIYFNDFDGGTMGPSNVGVGTNGVGQTASRWYDDGGSPNAGWKNNNSNWQIHQKSNSTSITVSSSMSGNVVGHNRNRNDADNNRGWYQENEQSIYTFSVSGLSKFTAIELMFDYAGELRGDSQDAASLVAYTGGWDTDTVGQSGFTLLSPKSGFGYSSIDGDDGIDNNYDNSIDSRLDNAQFGDADLSSNLNVGDTQGWNSSGYPGESGTALFDISGFGNADTINFRLAFGSNSTGQSGGVNFDNFKLTGVCITGSGPNCDNPPGGPIPEPATLSLAMLGMAAAYRRKKKAS